jgi:hypothetical protein
MKIGIRIPSLKKATCGANIGKACGASSIGCYCLWFVVCCCGLYCVKQSLLHRALRQAQCDKKEQVQGQKSRTSCFRWAQRVAYFVGDLASLNLRFYSAE